VVVVDFESLEEVRDVLKPQDTGIHKALGAEPVMPYPENQRKGVKGLLRVDNRFRIHRPERLRKLYKLRSSVERLNSRLSTMIGKITFKDLKAR
jgi:hypothetical protein